MKRDKNQETAKRLAEMQGLSELAQDVIADTDIDNIDALFGGLHTAEEVNKFVEKCFTFTEEVMA